MALTRRSPVALLVAIGLAACSAPEPTVPSPPSNEESDAAPSASAASPSASMAPSPGRPFDADAILLAMRESRRPDGVPDDIETDEIAAAVAEQIYTFDGAPWPEIVTSATCGPETCTLEVGGTPDGAVGEDLYTFDVTPTTGAVDLVSADLRGLPSAMLDDLDLMVRRGVDDPGSVVELLSASWLPPPNDGRFVLAYRSGGEEGSCQLNVTLDARSGSVLEQEALDC